MSRVIRASRLVLADGAVFEGEAIGPDAAVAAGEVVFNTAMTGYQEVLTDPSYAGQIITFTYTHIGNYGVTDLDSQSRSAFGRGVVVRELARRRSSWRGTDDLEDLLERLGTPGIAGVDTRRLTRHIRDTGAMPGAFGTAPTEELRAAAQAEPGTTGVDLVATVTTPRPYEVGGGPWRVVAYDFGIKRSILDALGELATVTVVPATTSAESVLEREPDGVFLSNGPGDPTCVSGSTEAVKELLGRVPIFGICLGHQILSLAGGAESFKLPFGHHGANHPVRNLKTGAVEITSQNHNFAVSADSVVDGEITHLNLNDGTVEGLSFREVPAFGVQHHPEACPGPHDSRYLFGDFDRLMAEYHGRSAVMD